MKKNVFLSCVVALTSAIASSTIDAQTILIQDTFERATSGSLANSSPTTDTIGSYTWTSRFGAVAQTTGGQLVSVPASGESRTSFIQLDSTYFTNNPNAYSLSMDVMLSSGSSTDNWFGVGFISGPSVSLNLTLPDERGGNPWIKLDQAGNLNVYMGRGTSNSVYSGTGYTSGQSYALELVLDTTEVNWSVAAYVNGTQLDLNAGDAESMVAYFSTNPTTLTSIGFSPNGDGSLTITGDDFTLASIPEDSTTALLSGLAILLTAYCLRKRATRTIK